MFHYKLSQNAKPLQNFSPLGSCGNVTRAMYDNKDSHLTWNVLLH